MTTSIPASTLSFLENLRENNSREWMAEHKKEYQSSEKALKQVYASIVDGLNETDEIEKLKVFRINRDVRFSNDKTPYNVHRSASFSRVGAQRRGGYYLRIEPGNKSAIAGGFFNPEPADLKRIRTEFQMDASEIREILSDTAFAKAYGGSFDAWNPVKTAPRGFDVSDPNIDLIRLKNFVVRKNFTDKEITSPDFTKIALNHFRLLRTFFDYMSDVLTTDLNGESLIDH